jgi:hypothetical protein
MKKVLIWESLGALIIILTGILFHFAYSNTGFWLLAWISPINESVWEHLKLGIWPVLFFALIEFVFIRTVSKNFLEAKAAQIYTTCAATLIIFYSYTGILGHNILAIDILTFVLAVLIGQFVSYKLLSMKELDEFWAHFASASLYILIGVFLFITYFPPHYPMFLDPISGTYGMPEKRNFLENALFMSKNTLLAILIILGAFFIMNITAPFRLWSLSRKMDKVIALLEKIAKK